MMLSKIKYLFVLVVVVCATSGIRAQCKVVINEIMASPPGLTPTNSIYDDYIQDQVNGPSLNAEWIELYNPDPCNAVDISCFVLGGSLRDSTQIISGNAASYILANNYGNFVFPQGTIIPPLGFVSFGGAASGATFKANSYYGTANYCANKRWFLRDSYGYVALLDASGVLVDAVYWAPTSSLTSSAVFFNQDTVRCACALPGGPGTATHYIPPGKNIPGIEYAGDNFTSNGSPNPGTGTNSLGYTMHRQYDGAPTWVIDGNKSLNTCNGGVCYTSTVNATNTNISCSQQTGSVTATNSFTGATHAPYTYSWSTGATSASVTGLPVGTYTVTLKDACGCTKTTTASIVSTAINLTVNTVPTTITCASPTATAQANATGGSGSYTYSWSAASQTTQTATGLAIGVYTVTATDANACTGTATVSITQLTGITVTAVSTPAACAQNNGTATATPTGTTTPFSYSWSGPSGNINQTTASVTGLESGVYTVTVTDVNGCTAQQTVSITQPSGFTLSSVSTPASCSANDGTATATPNVTGGTYTYSWSAAAQTTQTATALGVGSYTVVATDGNGCTASATISVTQPAGVTATTATTPTQCGISNGTATATTTAGASPFTYSWSDGQTAATATGLGASTYTVTVTDNNGCTYSVSAIVTQPGGVTVSTNQPPLICAGVQTSVTATVNGGSGPYVYSWNTGGTSSTISVTPLTTTTYTATVTDANNCSASQTVIVNVNNTPLLVDQSADQEFCEGGQATLSVNPSSGTSPYTYAWVSSETTNVISVSPSTSTSYSVTITDACNVSTTKTIQVTVNPIPVALFSGVPSPTCDTVCVIFHDQSTVSSGTVTTWLWNFGDGNTSTNPSPSNCYNSSGTVSVSLTVTSDKGCKHSVSLPVTIEVDPKPNPDFTYTPSRPSIMESPVVSFSSLASNAVSWSWTFGDSLNKADDTSTDAYPQHTYSAPGIYCIDLVVENKLGCVDSITKCLEVRPDWTFFVPNCFTPEGNGTNEIFKAEATNITNFEMYIYDRWGNEIFHSSDINIGWNGKVQGGSSNSVAQTDVYVWLIKFKDVNDHGQTYVGSVTLLR